MLIVCIGVEIYEKYLYIYSTIYYVSRKEFQCLFCTERWPKTSNYCTSLASYFPASLTPIYLVDHSSCGKETYLSAQYACEPPRLYIMVCVFLLSCRHLSACLLFRLLIRVTLLPLLANVCVCEMSEVYPHGRRICSSLLLLFLFQSIGLLQRV